ncbi:MAG: type II toxin-antitoxin system RelE/ParE family toxin [Tannerellaceae bacterium]|nr:type II toxin-antitoxin system RelE/ParE family toxin [Tannerellaceae bacterium]
MRVIWLETALSHLDGVFDYYIQYSQRAAYSMVKEISDTGKILQNHPKAGMVERFYEDAPESIRALIACKGLFKILYYERNNVIYIFAVFSCR